MTRSVLVTGGCGFIGSHFIRFLLQQRPGWHVVNLDKLTYAGNLANLRDVENHAHYRFVRGDVADSSLVNPLFQKSKLWGVVNFAAESHVDRSILDAAPFLRTNISGVHVLLDAARQHGIERFVQISTDEVYGDAEGMPPFSEDVPLRPSSPYAASKASADLLCLAYRRTYGVPVLMVRSTNNYGPYQFPEKLIPLMIRNALAGEALPVYGDGGQVRDWLYVGDNCEAIMRVLESGQEGSVYNVGTGEHWPNLEVVCKACQFLSEETGIDLKALLARIRFISDRPGHDRRYALLARKIRGELDWSPRMSFDEGLRTTVRWYLEHQDWVKQVTSGEYQAFYDAVYLSSWGQAPQ